MTAAILIDLITQEIAKETKIPTGEISAEDLFVNLGLDSVNGVYLLDILEKRTGLQLNPLLLWDYPTIKSLAEFLSNQIEEI
ncbi:MAG: acyl carrier protein [Cyclobacteriaceae bacterium]